jgi:hypothetical protein
VPYVVPVSAFVLALAMNREWAATVSRRDFDGLGNVESEGLEGPRRSQQANRYLRRCSELGVLPANTALDRWPRLHLGRDYSRGE